MPVVPDPHRHASYRAYANTYVCPQALHTDWNRQRIADKISAHRVRYYTGPVAEICCEKKPSTTPSLRPPSR